MVIMSRLFFWERPDLPQLAATYGLSLSKGSRSPHTRSPTTRSPANKSLTPRTSTLSEVQGNGSPITTSPPSHTAPVVALGGRLSPFPTERSRSPSLSPRTSQAINASEAQSRTQCILREIEWRRYYIETSDVEWRKVRYQHRLDEFQQMQVESIEGIDRIRIVKEWSAALPALNQYLSSNIITSAPSEQKAYIFPTSVSTPGNMMNPMASVGTLNNNSTNSNTAASYMSIALEITGQREHRSVLGSIRKATIKYRANEIQDMEQHRRLRIIYLYRIFINEMNAQMSQMLFKTRIQWACMDDESFSRYQEACAEQSAFQRIQEYKIFEEKFTVPLRQIHEIERQVRSQINIDERIELQQLLVHRPRGKRFRPMREIETDHVRTSTEPGLAPRVKGWLKNIIHHNPMPSFAEIYPTIAFVLSTDLKSPLVPAPSAKPLPTAESSNNNIADGENSDLHGSLKGMQAAGLTSAMTPQQAANETSTLVAPSFSSASPSAANYRSSEVSNNLTLSMQATMVASSAPSFDIVNSSPVSMAQAATQSAPSLAAGQTSVPPPSAAAQGANAVPTLTSPTGHFASKLRDEVKVERKSVFLIRAIQKLESARRQEIIRCEETARHTFSFQFSKIVAYRLAKAEEKESTYINPQKMRRKDSINRKYAK